MKPIACLCAIFAAGVSISLAQGHGSATAQVAATHPRGAFEVTSLLGRRLYAQPDDTAIRAARRKLAANPKDPALYLALSQAQANRRQYREAVATCTRGLRLAPGDAALLLERGHRELGLREFRRAERDLARATEIDPQLHDAWYHLALSHYFQAQFAAAATEFRRALDLAKADDDVIDDSNWLYVSLRRAGQPRAAAQVLRRIGPRMQTTDPHIVFYLHLVRFYQGTLRAAAIVPPKPTAPGDTEAELAFTTVDYGVGNWDLYHGRRPAALARFRQVVSGHAWNAWGFIGSEIELARGGNVP